MVRQRHIFYVEGYDPQGAEGYHGLFKYIAKRFQKIWPIKLDVSTLQLDGDSLAHWDIGTSGPNWQVSTRYEFLRMEDIIRTNMAQPKLRQLGQTLRWALDDLLSGATFRIFKASWKFEVHFLYLQLLALLQIGIPILGGLFAGRLASTSFGWPLAASLIFGLAVGCGLLVVALFLAHRLYVVRITNCWPAHRALSRGVASAFDRPIQIGAEQIVAAARDKIADEIVIVGHSIGGAIAPMVLSKALEIDPELGRHGPRIVLLTLGSLMPGVALHPAATKTRAAVQHIATEPSVAWIDVQARKDVLSFHNFDPVSGVGVDAGPKRCNPRIWRVRIREMLAPEIYPKMRWSLFRMHFQFVMGNDRRAPYDYVMLCCGPIAITDWPDYESDTIQSFLASMPAPDTTTQPPKDSGQDVAHASPSIAAAR